VKVSDTGHGISKENQSKIFKEIVQFHPEILQAGGGSGLGLWIVKGILDLHKGDISVSSAGEGFGTCFTFEVPMIRHPYSGVVLANSTMNSCKSGNRKQKADVSRDYEFSELIEQEGNTQSPFISAMHILIVDDSKMNRKMVSKFLRGDDYLCDEAEDGLEAIKMVKENLAKFEKNEIRKPYHAILMDCMMPLCNGPTATRKIREMGFTGLIFGLTGNGLKGDIEHFESCGANRVFIKPLDIEVFNKAIIGNINQSLSGEYDSVCSP
jgi:CheY-like chemotaxis protein